LLAPSRRRKLTNFRRTARGDAEDESGERDGAHSAGEARQLQLNEFGDLAEVVEFPGEITALYLLEGVGKDWALFALHVHRAR
jgi:hypothetical protein